MKRVFTLEYWIDEGWYVGRLKEVPGVFSQAETLKELEDNIRDAYQLMMATEVTPKLSVERKEKELLIKV
jgi:predicted RNase H-like HicB family nuclease